MSDDDKTKSRLSRWSKRKIAVAREQVVEDKELAVDPVDADQQDTQQAELEVQLEANRLAAEAVDLETLDEESDFSVFMKDGVPTQLKKQAMASLWRTSPVFANVDGLVDYDDDFGSSDLVMKTFKSAYQAGRGYLEMFKEKDAQEEGGDAVEEATEDTRPESPADTKEELIEGAGIEGADAAQADEPQEELEIVEEDPAPRVSLRRRLELDADS
ncbi:MAG: DUF3306 domain-containing protein [Rhizobiaceae bacterium]